MRACSGEKWSGSEGEERRGEEIRREGEWEWREREREQVRELVRESKGIREIRRLEHW